MYQQLTFMGPLKVCLKTSSSTTSRDFEVKVDNCHARVDRRVFQRT